MTMESASAGNAIGPIATGQRIEAIDTLRGFALLGILVMNVTGIAMPFAAYFSPMAYGGSGSADFGAWIFAHLFFDLKMMGIFSMLFGAGIILMAERADAAGRSLGPVYYRRILWLLLFGLIHAYLIWFGDILVTYALCGLILFLFRRRSAKTLIASGLVFLIIGALLSAGGGMALGQLRSVAQEIESKVAAGEEMTPRRQALVDQWQETRRGFDPTPEEIEDTLAAFRGNVSEVLRANTRETIMMHTQAVPFDLFWRAMALMLIGMGMMKAGVLTAERSPGFYNRWIVSGFGLGLPVIATGIWQMHQNGFDFISRFLADGQFNYFASVLVSMAYIGVIMRLCQSDRLPDLRRRLAAVGRMALTNYLMQSVIMVTIFFGYGLALFGQIGRFNLWWFILGVWVFQLYFSPWWLARFRFGPAEWLWRSLTYMKRQPMRLALPGG